MKREIADKWVVALRSGQYVQAKQALKTETGFCCLGVLCDLSNTDSFTQDEDTGNYEYAGAHDLLPKVVKDWAGVQNEDLFFIGQKTVNLAEMNDRGQSFSEIADVIEQNWEKL